MAFDPPQGESRLWPGRSNEGINTGAYDRFSIGSTADPPAGHFVYYDVATRKSVDKGRVNNWESFAGRSESTTRATSTARSARADFQI